MGVVDAINRFISGMEHLAREGERAKEWAASLAALGLEITAEDVDEVEDAETQGRTTTQLG